MRMVVGNEVEYGISSASADDPIWLSEGVIAHVDGLFRGRTDRFLGNGARAYVDHAHPEYSGPECLSARDALVWSLAGDVLCERAAHAASDRTGRPIILHRNNTDGKGNAYGYHENLLVGRAVPWPRIVAQMSGHLVSRQVITGAGRVGLGQRGEASGFQISQRADFIETRVAPQTTSARPVINARDEPHADPARWRRLHVITADACMGHVATWVSLGSAALVLAAIEADDCQVPELVDPVAAMHAWSRDLTLTLRQPCLDGVARSALDLQHLYLRAAASHTDALADGPQVWDAWHQLVTDAEAGGATGIADRIDWAAKHRLLTAMMARHDFDWSDPRAQAADLQWHELSERGLARRLFASGHLVGMVDHREVDAAMHEAPVGTRAAARARALHAHQRELLHADWAQVMLADGIVLRWNPFGD